MIEKEIFPRHHRAPRLVFWAVIISATMALIASPAFAGLGGDASSVLADQVHMQGTLRTTQSESYTVHEITGASGVVIREYVAPATGKIFAVAWQGSWPPDMRQVLANYFAQYQQAAQTQANLRPGRRPLLINQPGLVVESGGHMRSFAGRAYIPDLLPAGVKAEAIR